MALNFGVINSGCLLVLLIMGNAFSAPQTISRSAPIVVQKDPKYVEIKLPVKITSMEDLVAWAKNAMRTMASRIDITLATVDEPRNTDEVHLNSSPGSSRFDEYNDYSKEQRQVQKSTQQKQQQQKNTAARLESRRPGASGALVSTYASLLDPRNAFETISGEENELVSEILPRGNVNAYLPFLLDDAEIARYREEALKKYYRDNEQAKREKIKKESKDKTVVKQSQVAAQKATRITPSNDDVKISPEKRQNNENDVKKNNIKPTPIISVPFEAIVTITRENLVEPTRPSIMETRDPPDEFPPYFDRVEQQGQEISEKVEPPMKTKDKSRKRQIATLGDLIRTLGLAKKFTTNSANRIKATQSLKSGSTRPKKPSETFSPPPQIQFEDEPLRQRINETSQRQEFEDEEEESEGSLGSIADLLPLVIPILEDISDPNSETDLGELLEAAIPLVGGLSDPDDPDSVDIIGMIGPILTTIIGGKDGQGSDIAAVLGPLVQLIAPLIGPIIGPLIGPLLRTSSNPPSEGSSLAALLTAVLGPLSQPTEPGGMSPLSVLTAGIIAALSRELKPGAPGGLDVGALVGAILSGVLAGTSAGLSGGSSSDNKHYQPYGPYGTGPVQAGSSNAGASTGFVFPGPQSNTLHQSHPVNARPVSSAGNIAEHHHRPNIHQTTRRPYNNLPQRYPQGPQPNPPGQIAQPPIAHLSYVQHPPTGPLQAGTTNTGGGSSYLPYGNNGVPANSVNPIGLIGSSIKDILGAGIQVVSSVINAVFGIIGASSSEQPKPVYGPPHPGPYGPGPR